MNRLPLLPFASVALLILVAFDPQAGCTQDWTTSRLRCGREVRMKGKVGKPFWCS
jgi:hypothetical protein